MPTASNNILQASKRGTRLDDALKFQKFLADQRLVHAMRPTEGALCIALAAIFPSQRAVVMGERHEDADISR